MKAPTVATVRIMFRISLSIVNARHVEPSQSCLPRFELDERLSRPNGISPGMIPQQQPQRSQAGELCFTRLISLLLGDPGQRSVHRAPSTAGGCNAEASRRDLFERRAI
jgi:hypothetical protein